MASARGPRGGSGNDVVREEGGVAREFSHRGEFVQEQERISGRVGVVIGCHRRAGHKPGRDTNRAGSRSVRAGATPGASLYGPCASTPPPALIQTEPPAHVARGFTEQGLGRLSAGARGKSSDYPSPRTRLPWPSVLCSQEGDTGHSGTQLAICAGFPRE